MDPHEVRIGNIVLSGNELAEVVAVEDNTNNHIDVKPINKDGGIKVALITITAVPLTVSLLARCCNFSRHGKLMIRMHEETHFLKAESVSGKLHIILLNNDCLPLIHFWEVRTLHQLQNLYFILTASEMSIDMTCIAAE